MGIRRDPRRDGRLQHRGASPVPDNRKECLPLLTFQLVIDDVTLNNSGEKFLQNKEMYPPYKPFKIVLTPEGAISHVAFKEGDPIWSMNFKRAIASVLQFQIKSSGAFVVNEVTFQGIISSFLIKNIFLRSLASMAPVPRSTLCRTRPTTSPFERRRN